MSRKHRGPSCPLVATRWIALLAPVLLSAACGDEPPPSAPIAAPTARAAAPLQGWPPVVGESYPDFEFTDLDGRPVRLSSFKGKVLLIEPIGMNCPACNAFSGANREGMSGFRGLRPQQGLQAIEDYLPAYAGGARIDDSELVFIQLLLYNFDMGAPTRAEARAWVDHFALDQLPNYIALIADQRFQNRASYDLIPGFQLVDRNLVLRVDATGHRPRHDLYRELLPRLGDLLRDRA